MTFLPTKTFHVSARALIANSISEQIDDRAIDYVTHGKGIGSFRARNCIWQRLWQSSLDHVDFEFSAFAMEKNEAQWKLENLV